MCAAKFAETVEEAAPDFSRLIGPGESNVGDPRILELREGQYGKSDSNLQPNPYALGLCWVSKRGAVTNLRDALPFSTRG